MEMGTSGSSDLAKAARSSAPAAGPTITRVIGRRTGFPSNTETYRRPSSRLRIHEKLAGARQRLREIVLLGMKTWLSAETRKELPAAESWAREQVRVHFRRLEWFRAEQSQREGREQSR
jgi:hypothetical protein